jgi:hypothetical protein
LLHFYINIVASFADNIQQPFVASTLRLPLHSLTYTQVSFIHVQGLGWLTSTALFPNQKSLSIMAAGPSIVEVIKCYRHVYDQENQHLTETERNKGWKRHWNNICAKVTDDYGAGNYQASLAEIGMDLPSQRPGHVGTLERCFLLV